MLIEIRSYLNNVLVRSFSAIFLTLTKLRLFFHRHNSLRKIAICGILSICHSFWPICVAFRAENQRFCGKKERISLFLWQNYICVFLTFFNVNEKNNKNLSKILCIWKIICIFVTLLEK